MKKLITTIFLFVIIPMTISNALTFFTKINASEPETNIEEEIQTTIYPNVLTVIWNKRKDLQLRFPDGENGIGTMKEWTLVEWARKIGYKEHPALLQYNEEMEKEYIYWKYRKLERKISEIAERTYTIYEYDCKHFTNDLQNELNKVNISSKAITGLSDEVGHRWIAIEFEPITGDIVEKNKYNNKFPNQQLTQNYRKQTLINLIK